MKDELQAQQNLWKVVNYVLSVFFIVAGGYMVFEVFHAGYDLYGEYAPESGFLPLIVAAILIILGIFLVIQTWRGKYLQVKAFPPKENVIRMVFLVALSVVSLLLVNILGLTLSLFLIFLGTLLFVYRYKFVYSLIVSAVSIAIIYVIFRVGFSIRFVTGVFGI